MAHAPEDLHDPVEDHEIDDPDEKQEAARHRLTDQARDLVQGRAVVGDVTAQAPDAEREQRSQREDDRRVPEREEEPDAERALPVGHQLAGGVVDRADVIGVEGMAQAQRVRGDADADPEDPTAPAEIEVMRDDDPKQQEEPDRMQQRDHEEQHAGAPPLCRGERTLDLLPARRVGAVTAWCTHGVSSWLELPAPPQQAAASLTPARLYCNVVLITCRSLVEQTALRHHRAAHCDRLCHQAGAQQSSWPALPMKPLESSGEETEQRFPCQASGAWNRLAYCDAP